VRVLREKKKIGTWGDQEGSWGKGVEGCPVLSGRKNVMRNVRSRRTEKGRKEGDKPDRE